MPEPADLRILRASADASPADVEAQIAAAYGCDRQGEETAAIVYYDRAMELGVPDDKRRRFFVGYGSTLRNVGRHDDSARILGAADKEFPGYPAYGAFLALTLHESGQVHRALAMALKTLADAATPALEGYERALRGYAGALEERDN